jgi:hypothetical protein
LSLLLPFLLLFSFLLALPGRAEDGPPPPSEVAGVPDYSRNVAPLLRKYCGGCHNAEDREGELVMDTFAALMKGGEHGAVVLPGESAASRLVGVLTGAAEPKMPPKKRPAPLAEEIEVLRRWIDAGARGPAAGADAAPELVTPAIEPPSGLTPGITALAYSPDGSVLAVGRFRRVELWDGEARSRARELAGAPGKVHSLGFSSGGTRLIAASGVDGLYGRAIVWRLEDGSIVREITGHRDTLYDAALAPGDRLLATASYDRRIILWDLETGEELRTIGGHNDAVYDLAFSPDGAVLASASGDQTVKLWSAATGERLDTLHQALAEQYTVAFSNDGGQVVAAGADNRIRVWALVSREAPGINPLLHARFGHEGAIVRLLFSADGGTLVSAADDGTIKLWETEGYTQLHALEESRDVPAALAVSPARGVFAAGFLDGALAIHPFPPRAQPSDAALAPETPAPLRRVRPPGAPGEGIEEREPNDAPSEAQPVAAPVVAKGAIHAERPEAPPDIDLFRFEARAGEEWMLEIDAARSRSPLDSKLEVLAADGSPIERLRLQAVRDSYYTFRGKDSETSDDFRLHNWEEMELDEYLYTRGEVVKLWHYPRGPDSGFIVYPGAGKRHGFFDTTPLAHALGEPCYIVRPLAPGAEPLPNGLPVFPLHFENDDDSLRALGADSRLAFTAPRDGSYLVRVSDVRGFQGAEFRYELTIRPRRPGFKVSVEGGSPAVGAGSGKEFKLTAERIDGFDGEIRVDIEGLPPGFHASTPLVIEAGQHFAFGTLNALPGAASPSPEAAAASRLTARAVVDGEEVVEAAGTLGEIQLAGKPKLLVRIERALEAGAGAGAAAEGAPDPDRPLELAVSPGETITATVRVERNGFAGRVELGNADAGRNLPHGVYVDNIGLNGLLIVEDRDERTFFITAAKGVKPQVRPFFLRANADGGQTSWPVLLRVREK